MKMKLLMISISVVCLPVIAVLAEMAPFVIPMTFDQPSAIAFKSEPIRTNSPRILVSDGHFAVEKQRIRIWGVNTCFGASFPEHVDAERIARRLAEAGINSVRFHHMDTAAYPRGILDPRDPLKLSPEALDRLDYFIDQLARHGIYANINLHVGRKASPALKLPDPGTSYDKITGIFTPQLIEVQKQYARDLLGHVNACRKIRYADDPAVAFVEITNEDSLFMWDALEYLKTLPEYYQAILCAKYAAWLKSRYGNTAKLRKAWAQGTEPLGQNILVDVIAEKPNSTAKGWRIEQHQGCSAIIAIGTGAVLRTEIAKADNTSWHIQVKQVPLELKNHQYYTLSFRARADQPRSMSYGVMQDESPWKNMGLSGSVKLSKDWQSFRAGFLANADEDAARLSFSLGGAQPSVEINDVSLAPGGREGLLKGESIEAASVALFGSGEIETRIADRFRFLADIEKTYFDDMKEFLNRDLGVKALVTGTIVFGPCGLYGQSGMDYIDSHAYWQHPHFPGKPWDSTNWIVEQKAMVDNPQQATLPRIAFERMAGKPFTVSEYNHPAPNDFQTECVPMMASYAACQDWDGVWFFAYRHRDKEVDRDYFDGFFDIDANPAKWGFMRAGAAIFRQNTMPPFNPVREISIAGNGDFLSRLGELHMQHDRDLMSVAQDALKGDDKDIWLTAQVKIDLAGKGKTFAGQAAHGPLLSWTTNEHGLGTFYAEGPGALVLISHLPGEGAAKARGLEISAPSFAAMTVTSLDGQPFAGSSTILVAACGRCENKDMDFSADRRSVGRHWGHGQVQVETVTAKATLPSGNWICHALRPDGTRAAEVKLTLDSSGKTILDLSPECRTMWYLLEKKDAQSATGN